MTYFLSLILLATLPFQFTLSFNGLGDIPLARLLSMGIIFSFSAHALIRQSWRLPAPLFTGALLSVLGLALTSIGWTLRPDLALPKIAFLFNLLPLIFVWHDMWRQSAAHCITCIQVFLWSATSAAVVAVGIFLTQFIFGVSVVFHTLVDRVLPFFLGQELATLVASYPSLLVNIDGATVLRATAFFPDPHVASYFFGLAGFLAFGLARMTGQQRYVWCAAGLFLADILTFSRGGYVGLLAGMIVYAGLSFSAFNHQQKVRVGWVLMALLIGLSVFGQPVLSRFATSFSVTDTSSTERLALWREALPTIAEHPILGVGLGNYLSSARPLYTPGTPFYAHNLYLDIALEMGLIGLAMFLLLFLSAFMRLIRVRRSDPWAPAILAALTLYLTHSIFETAIFSLHNTLVLTLLLALAHRTSEQNT